MWGLAAAFYLFDFFQRVTPAALAQELSRELAPTATALGWLSSSYFYAYAVMQLPAGLLADKFGTRKLFMAATAAAGVGTLLFALSDSAATAMLGRGLIGGADAVAWIGMLKLAAHWFSPQKFASITGLSLSVGTAGAIAAGLPLRLLADQFGWRWVIGGSALVAFALTFAIMAVLRDDPADRGYRSWAPSQQTEDALASINLRESFHSLSIRDLVLLCIGQMAVTGGMITMVGLWGVPFLTTVFEAPSKIATLSTSMIMVTFAAGSLVFGPWSDRSGQRKKPLLFGTTLTLVGFLILASGITLSSLWLTNIVLWAIGFCAGSMVVSFAFGKDLVRGQRTATITALVNFSVTLGAIALQPLFGAILDWQWNGTLRNGLRYYDTAAFQWGFGIIAIWIAFTTLAIAMAKDPSHAKALTADSTPKQS